MRLDELKPGNHAIISSVGGSGPLRRRILDMGLTPKTKVFVRKVAPMGDPIELTIRGYELTIRADDASIISVTPIDHNDHHKHAHPGTSRGHGHRRGKERRNHHNHIK